jgi:hypothetical protein
MDSSRIVLGVKLTQEDQAALRARAAQENRSLSYLVGQFVHQGLKTYVTQDAAA